MVYFNQMDIIDILIMYRKDRKLFGYSWDINKVDITDFKYFVINNENIRTRKQFHISTIIKRNNAEYEDFSVLSINDDKLDSNLKEFVLNDVNNMIYQTKSMVNIIGRRMQEDPNLQKTWKQIDMSKLKTNKKYIDF